MSEIAVFVKLTAQDGKRDELLAALGQMLPTVESEPGTLQYLSHSDNTDENAVWLYERYRDQAALDAHSGSEAMAELIGSLGGLIGDAPMMVQTTVLDGKGG